VLTNEDKAAADARIGTQLALRERSALMGLIRACFARTQTWLQAGKYLNALVSDLPSRNGWTVAEQSGDLSPDKTQRLLNRASWDEAAAMSQVRRYAAAGLDVAARRSRRKRMTVGALDETGQAKQGSATSGVKRQYMGCAGRVANGINTVHLEVPRLRWRLRSLCLWLNYSLTVVHQPGILVFSRGNVATRRVKSFVVVPVHPFRGGHGDIPGAVPRSLEVDELFLVQRVHGLGGLFREPR